MTTPPSILDISSLPPQTAPTKKTWTKKPKPTQIPKPTIAMIPRPTDAVQTVPTRVPTTAPSLPPTSPPMLPPKQSSEAVNTAPPTTSPTLQQTTTRNLGKKSLIDNIEITFTSDTPPKSTGKPFVAGAETTEGPKLQPQTLFSTKGKRV